jgi:hypothetical protein
VADSAAATADGLSATSGSAAAATLTGAGATGLLLPGLLMQRAAAAAADVLPSATPTAADSASGAGTGLGAGGVPAAESSFDRSLGFEQYQLSQNSASTPHALAPAPAPAPTHAQAHKVPTQALAPVPESAVESAKTQAEGAYGGGYSGYPFNDSEVDLESYTAPQAGADAGAGAGANAGATAVTGAGAGIGADSHGYTMSFNLEESAIQPRVGAGLGGTHDSLAGARAGGWAGHTGIDDDDERAAAALASGRGTGVIVEEIDYDIEFE